MSKINNMGPDNVESDPFADDDLKRIAGKIVVSMGGGIAFGFAFFALLRFLGIL